METVAAIDAGDAELEDILAPAAQDYPSGGVQRAD